jgi:HAD superfamily hydrolase (TIGR01549 family)
MTVGSTEVNERGGAGSAGAGTHISVVVFDVGETLVDETEQWEPYARAIGVPTFTLFALVGTTIARGEPHRHAFELIGREPFDVEPAGGQLYPDVLPCLERLQAAGYAVGIAGNQPSAAAEALRRLGCEADFIATSEAWGVAKPAAEFFERLAVEAGVAPAEIAYVGDRVDNDVEPAQRAGMFAVHIRRGPWGFFQDGGCADAQIDSLDELPTVLP